METFRTKEKIKDLYVYLNDRMKSWPQYEKYALSEYCRCKLLHMIELCVAINKSSKAKTKVYELDKLPARAARLHGYCAAGALLE